MQQDLQKILVAVLFSIYISKQQQVNLEILTAYRDENKNNDDFLESHFLTRKDGQVVRTPFTVSSIDFSP